MEFRSENHFYPFSSQNRGSLAILFAEEIAHLGSPCPPAEVRRWFLIFFVGNLAGILWAFSDPQNKGSKILGRISEHFSRENSCLKTFFSCQLRSADMPPWILGPQRIARFFGERSKIAAAAAENRAILVHYHLLSRNRFSGCDEALFSEEKQFFSEKLVRISTGKAIQWRGLADSMNCRTLKSEKLLSSSPSQKSVLNSFRNHYIRFGQDLLNGPFLEIHAMPDS